MPSASEPAPLQPSPPIAPPLRTVGPVHVDRKAARAPSTTESSSDPDIDDSLSFGASDWGKFLDKLCKLKASDLPEQKDSPLLRELSKHRDTQGVQELITSIRGNHYHDFGSEETCPQTALYTKLSELGLKRVAKRVLKGELDGGTDVPKQVLDSSGQPQQ